MNDCDYVHWWSRPISLMKVRREKTRLPKDAMRLYVSEQDGGENRWSGGEGVQRIDVEVDIGSDRLWRERCWCRC